MFYENPSIHPSTLSASTGTQDARGGSSLLSAPMGVQDKMHKTNYTLHAP